MPKVGGKKYPYTAKGIAAAKKAMKKGKLTVAQKYSQLKKQTEDAGMKVVERNGKIMAIRTKKK